MLREKGKERRNGGWEEGRTERPSGAGWGEALRMPQEANSRRRHGKERKTRGIPMRPTVII